MFLPKHRSDVLTRADGVGQCELADLVNAGHRAAAELPRRWGGERLRSGGTARAAAVANVSGCVSVVVSICHVAVVENTVGHFILAALGVDGAAVSASSEEE